MYVTLSGLPMHARIGRARSNVFSSPPTMIVSVAFFAPISPPLTGASSIDPPLAATSPDELLA